MSIKKLLVATLLVVSVILSSINTYADSATPGAGTARFSYVLQAKDAKFQRGKKGEDTLVLKNVPERLAMFSKEPQRIKRLIEVRGLVDDWNTKNKGSFKNNPPNGQLTFIARENGRQVRGAATLELKDPQYDAQKAVLVFKVKNLGKSELPYDTDLKRVAFFIDFHAGKLDN